MNGSADTSWGDAARTLATGVTVLVGDGNGGYPSGNSLVVQGAGETVIIDPSVTVVAKGGAGVPVDAVINSHGHEDHMAGNGLYADARLHIHEADLLAAQSLDGLMEIYGFPPEEEARTRVSFVEEFHYTDRPDALGFTDGHVFDLGGTTVEAVHLPGHTRGHSGFRISGGVFFLSDIDLTGFGPYYGDVWSDLEDFEASLHQVREEEADFYVTFHQKGIIEGRARFLEMIDGYLAVIPRRHAAMLGFLAEPRSLGDFATHRFIYREHIPASFADRVELRCAELHVARMLRRGEAEATDDGRYLAV
jgi:glyoxylase-like metal-dependent hydrolase (beta-lactamase superfamily II)